MQIHKIIPSNPNIVQVRNTLAVYGGLTVDTRDLGTLCARARSGGTGGYAFGIVENGGALNDGHLIAVLNHVLINGLINPLLSGCSQNRMKIMFC